MKADVIKFNTINKIMDAKLKSSPEIIEDELDQFALKIAEQAVNDVKKENIEADLHDAGWNGACNQILSRIKKLIKES